MTPPVVLTIAGSDSGGGAGIQADLLTFAALGAYGTSVVTAITAQNTTGVLAIHPVPAEIVAAQLDAVLSDFAVAAVKVGMIGDPAVAEVIVSRLADLPNLVVDPVLVSTSGARLTDVAAVAALVAYPCVLTPNRREARALLGCFAATGQAATPGRRGDRALRGGPAAAAEGAETDVVAEMRAAAVELAGLGARAVVVTGSELAVDVLWHAGETVVLPGEPVTTANSHGTGCTFSSAVAVRLAAGDAVPEAVRAAKRYVTAALRGGSGWRLGAGPGPLDHFV